MRERPEVFERHDRIYWLCVLVEKALGDFTLEPVPMLLTHMDSIVASPALNGHARALFNARQLFDDLTTVLSLRQEVALNVEHHYQNQTQSSYEIDPFTLRFTRTSPMIDPLVDEAWRVLCEPLLHRQHGMPVADPSRQMLVRLMAPDGRTMISEHPIHPITAPIPLTPSHALTGSAAPPIVVPVADLLALARVMDGMDDQEPGRRKGNWEHRFEDIIVLVPRQGQGLVEEQYIELTPGALRMTIGLPGVGKTTLLMLLGLWLDMHGYRAAMFFTSIEVGRQYQADLLFYGVSVAMLVGQNPKTLRQHADRLADAIAANDSRGGYGLTAPCVDNFSLECVLPAFAAGATPAWSIDQAPCSKVLQNDGDGKERKHLCPLFAACGRQKGQRSLVDANIWVGHVLSLDTDVPYHTLEVQMRYFEKIARGSAGGGLHVAIFDEGDMVQATLDQRGTAVMGVSGAPDSIHRVVQEQVLHRFASGDNHQLVDVATELYSRELGEFGSHNYSMVHTVQNVDAPVRERFKDRLLTPALIIGDILEGFGGDPPKRDQMTDRQIKRHLERKRALMDFWDRAAYTAYYDRNGDDPTVWHTASWTGRILGLAPRTRTRQHEALIRHFRRYLAERLTQRRNAIIEDITELFLSLCFGKKAPPLGAEDAMRLLVCVTFMILGYQRIMPMTNSLVAQGVIKEDVAQGHASRDLLRFMPENLLGSLAGVRYSLREGASVNGARRDVELSYIAFRGVPRMLLHHFHHLMRHESATTGPAVLVMSATSYMHESPAFHVRCGDDPYPHYVLKSRKGVHCGEGCEYAFRPVEDPDQSGVWLRYSGAGDLGERNLKLMLDALVSGGVEHAEIYRDIQNFDVREFELPGQGTVAVRRKAGIIVNSYRHARLLKAHLDRNHREIGLRTRAIVHHLEKGDAGNGYVTPSQAEALGDDEDCDIIIFPMNAIGRGVNIVFTKGPRERDAALGNLYFLTRPHPSGDDLQLLTSIAARASETFDRHRFGPQDDLAAIAKQWWAAKREVFRLANRLLQEPLQASRLGAELFKPFTANQMVSILQAIGRGMRNGCPVRVVFMDAAWAPRSAIGQTDSTRSSMLVMMRAILEEYLNHPDDLIRQIYQELYGMFLEPLRHVQGLLPPRRFRLDDDGLYGPDPLDNSSGFMEF